MPEATARRPAASKRELRGLAYQHIKTAKMAVSHVPHGSEVLLHLERAIVALRRLEVTDDDSL